MKKILVLHTGGTIAMHEDEHGQVGLQSTNPLYETTKRLASLATIVEENYANLPSPHITPTFVILLATTLKEKVKDEHYDGVVITHGTDTLEESAYLLHLLWDSHVPIVMTGAMRSSNELSADGPYNYVNALRIASSEKANGRGVLVTFNGDILTAEDVTKVDSSKVNAFQSPTSGPIGLVTKEDIIFFYDVKKKETFHIDNITKHVPLLKVYSGIDQTVIDAVIQTNIDGLVIEAFGQGNIPPALVPSIEQLVVNDIPVVVVSRSLSGYVQPTYTYEGGGGALKQKGVIFGGSLSGQKARLKLLIALEANVEKEKIQHLF